MGLSRGLIAAATGIESGRPHGPIRSLRVASARRGDQSAGVGTAHSSVSSSVFSDRPSVPCPSETTCGPRRLAGPALRCRVGAASHGFRLHAAVRSGGPRRVSLTSPRVVLRHSSGAVPLQVSLKRHLRCLRGPLLCPSQRPQSGHFVAFADIAGRTNRDKRGPKPTLADIPGHRYTPGSRTAHPAQPPPTDELESGAAVNSTVPNRSSQGCPARHATASPVMDRNDAGGEAPRCSRRCAGGRGE